MEKTPDLLYTELFHQLASPIGSKPEALADMFREVERMHSTGQIADWQLHNAREAYAKTTGSRAGDAAVGLVDDAKQALQAGAYRVRERTHTAVATYTSADPVKTILVAAGVGALLMRFAVMLARSGVQTVKRKAGG